MEPRVWTITMAMAIKPASLPLAMMPVLPQIRFQPADSEASFFVSLPPPLMTRKWPNPIDTL